MVYFQCILSYTSRTKLLCIIQSYTCQNEEKLEDTKAAIKGQINNGQNKRDKMRNNDL